MLPWYSPEGLLRGVRNPELILGELRRINTELNRTLTGTPIEYFDVMDADWDNLLIFDACRYDLFANDCSLPGELRRIDTGAGDSPEFMDRHFDGEYHDTVYITSNPYAVDLDPGTFHAVVNLFEDCWDHEAETVPPEVITDAGLEATETYPNKRLILHYMQPHFPFIGQQARSMDTGNISGDVVGEEVTDENRPGIWSQLQRGQTGLSVAEVIAAYRENFRVVEAEGRRFWEGADGKSVVTSDHGNLVGERLKPLFLKTYGHTAGVRHDALNKIPWLEMPYSTRKTVVEEKPESISEVDGDIVEDRLEHLGYKT